MKKFTGRCLCIEPVREHRKVRLRKGHGGYRQAPNAGTARERAGTCGGGGEVAAQGLVGMGGERAFGCCGEDREREWAAGSLCKTGIGKVSSALFKLEAIQAAFVKTPIRLPVPLASIFQAGRLREPERQGLPQRFCGC